METEMKSLGISNLRKSKSSGSNITNRAHYEYTSLKDILDSPRGRRIRRNFINGSGNELLPGIDPSAINIRNPLVRHAATIYLQSAALIATKDQSFMEGVWLRQDQRSNWGCVAHFFSIVREYVVRFLPSGQRRTFACHSCVH
jgi:hypothetical protein